MSLAPWRSPLARALHLHRSQPQARYFQLATVSPEGLPTNRTVVFRGFRSDSEQIQVVTDSRSEKITHIKSQPWAEACWYFNKTREQFRIAGQLILVDANYANDSLQSAREHLWQKLSDSARLQFTWADPGKLRAEQETFSASPPFTDEPLANFCLLLLEPKKVDHLELKGNPQNRYFYFLQPDQTWSSQAVNP